MNLSLSNRIHTDAKRVDQPEDAPSLRPSAVVSSVGSSGTGASGEQRLAQGTGVGRETDETRRERRETRSAVESARRTVAMLENVSADSVRLAEGFRRMRALADRVADPSLSSQDRALVEVEYLELKVEMKRAVTEARHDLTDVDHTSLPDEAVTTQANATASATARLLS